MASSATFSNVRLIRNLIYYELRIRNRYEKCTGRVEHLNASDWSIFH